MRWLPKTLLKCKAQYVRMVLKSFMLGQWKQKVYNYRKVNNFYLKYINVHGNKDLFLRNSCLNNAKVIHQIIVQFKK